MSQAHGKNVLLIDNDFQAAVTKFFGKHSYDKPSMEDVLRNPMLSAEDVIIPSGRWGLDIIPANMNMIAAADDLITDKDSDQIGRIRNILEQVEEEYDYCIIDCHPSVGIEVLNALAAAEDIIIPIKADKNALDGMEELDDIIQEIRPYNEKLESVRCLVTMYTKDIDVIKGEEVLRNSKYDVFTTHIRHEFNGQYAFVDNVNRYQDKLYVCYDNTATKDNVGDTDPNYKALSFAFPTTSGWQLLEGFDPEHPLEMWCEKLGGSSVGKGNGAYLWSNNNAAWCVLFVFGGADNGAGAGLPYVLASYGSGSAYWDVGGVLLKKRQ